MKAIKMHCGHGSRKKRDGSGIDLQGLRRRFSSTYVPISEEVLDDRTFD
jgi:hypothetical protein